MVSDNITHCYGYENIARLSRDCINSLDTSLLECIRNNDEIKSKIRTLTGLWGPLITICGIFGNLLTLLAVPYAARHKRYELHRNFRTTTIFVLHLAFVDLCCCVIYGPIFVSTYFSKRWPLGFSFCKMVCPITIFISIVDWLSLSFIALSRCINLTRPLFWSNFCDKNLNIVLTIGSIWILSGLYLVPYFIEPGVRFGWNCKNGQCCIIKDSSLPSLKYHTSITLLVPILVVVCSYAVIFGHVKQTSKDIRRDQDLGSKRFYNRELKMTWSILLIFFCYIVCTTPITTLIVLRQEDSNYWIIANAFYLLLFILNFWMYSYQNEQYQKAFDDYVKMLKHLLLNGSLKDYRSRHHEECVRLSCSGKVTNETI